jgi:integrase
MRTLPERLATRQEAERAQWKLANQRRTDCTHDRRFRCLVLLTAFTSLRWGEATTLRRADVDLKAGTVRVRAAYVERSTGEMLIGPPNPKGGRRIVGIPTAVVPDLTVQLQIYVKDEPGALVFPDAQGGPIRRGNFNKMSAWPQSVASIAMPGPHFHG